MNFLNYQLNFALINFVWTTTSCVLPLSLHDALPIWLAMIAATQSHSMNFHISLPLFVINICTTPFSLAVATVSSFWLNVDRKSTRLNSSHPSSSYAVFCMKKKYPKLELL